MPLDPRSTFPFLVDDTTGTGRKVAYGAENGRAFSNNVGISFWQLEGTNAAEDAALKALTDAIMLARQQRAAQPKPRGE